MYTVNWSVSFDSTVKSVTVVSLTLTEATTQVVS